MLPTLITRCARAGALILAIAAVSVNTSLAGKAGSIQRDPRTGDSIVQVLYAPLSAGAENDVDPGGELVRGRVAAELAASGPRYTDVSGRQVSAAQLRKFLRRYRSPMAPYADSIIRAANRYGADPRIVVAIAGVESTFGRHQRGYNAWGWNGGKTRWSSWQESIDSYTRMLAQRYPSHRDPSRIARRYNPNTPTAWSRKVRGWVESIDRVSV